MTRGSAVAPCFRVLCQLSVPAMLTWEKCRRLPILCMICDDDDRMYTEV